MVDGEAFLDPQHRATAAEIPGGSAGRTENRTHTVGGRGRFDSGREVETDRVGHVDLDLLAAARGELVLPAHFLAVISKDNRAFVGQAEAAHITVVRRVDAA